MAYSLSSRIKYLRELRGWSQKKLADKTGLTRGYISVLELRETIHPRTDVLLKLAQAFDIPVEELYEAAGYEVEKKPVHLETHEELLEQLRLKLPTSVILYADFPEGQVPLEVLYLPHERFATGKPEAYVLTKGEYCPPLLHDDIVFVDKELTVEPGDTVLFIKDGKEMAGVLEEQNGEFLLVVGDKKFNKYDCEYAAVVIMFIRRLSYR